MASGEPGAEKRNGVTFKTAEDNVREFLIGQGGTTNSNNTITRLWKQ